MIEAHGLAKRYGSKTAVDHVTFTVQPGRVTGFLGPNGAGKSTTMRMIMGLDKPTAGSVTVNGHPYAKLARPLAEVGALLEAKAVHSGRSAFNHLLALAATHGIPQQRVHEVIELTGLESVAKKRVGGFSLGMGQRLGIAAALLGDPRTLILDEPVNGLDPEGVIWVRNLAKHLASEGRTVFLSSHLMSEVALTADHVIVIGRGRILADTSVAELIAASERKHVRVRSPQAGDLAMLLREKDAKVATPEADILEVVGPDAASVGELAAAGRIVLHELTPIQSTLEEAYMSLTADAVEYRSEDLADGAEEPQPAPRPLTGAHLAVDPAPADRPAGSRSGRHAAPAPAASAREVSDR
ncbi:ABC transporter ATP-binding protein [Myceligenerans pegani]|uniref:ATP-binding cassette domain-containing protein n=1 Tax=Myceligenerans pegani TaxID=2776917 RepID=A0ABR9MXD7_9MICO|nr:ATP-binding cassette domain-containing protein [Myceligenerans sp. TRM 65318]MBE1875589.1 ATP-binding cassette domain-containing protein [Myceligenerans sp. TRM 65318]MBE3017860.1 ATP-binding cassette domain-containing protein [Myceligenerans sp. TRM 65318]